MCEFRRVAKAAASRSVSERARAGFATH